MNNNLGRLAGAALGGMLMGVGGLGAVVVSDSLTFLLAGILIARISAPGENRGEGAAVIATAASAGRRFRQEWLAGLTLIRRDRIVAGVFGIEALASLSDGIIIVLLVVYVTEILGAGAPGFGLLFTARGVSGLIGSAVIGRAGRSLPPNALIASGNAAVGIILLLIFNTPIFGPVLVLFCLYEIPFVAMDVGRLTLMQRTIDDRYLGRIFGALGTTNALFVLIGQGIGAAFGDLIGVRPVLSLAAALYISAAAIAWLTTGKVEG